MAKKVNHIAKRLSWGGFFRLLIHLPSFLKLFFRLAVDARVSLAPKVLLIGMLTYVILPADLLPDFLLGVGQLDDLAVILAGAKIFLHLCPAEVVQEHVEAIATGI